MFCTHLMNCISINGLSKLGIPENKLMPRIKLIRVILEIIMTIRLVQKVCENRNLVQLKIIPQDKHSFEKKSLVKKKSQSNKFSTST